MGSETFLSALKLYAANPKKDLNKLNSYAKKMRVSGILRQYLEVLLWVKQWVWKRKSAISLSKKIVLIRKNFIIDSNILTVSEFINYLTKNYLIDDIEIDNENIDDVILKLYNDYQIWLHI